MLSLLNKSGGEKSTSGQGAIPWRPDFRDVAQLPDTKTVRTTFFVNTLAIGLTAALLLFVAQREWSVASLRRSQADVDSRIATLSPGSQKAQAAFLKFQAEEKKFNEAYGFIRNPFRFSDLLIHLGSILPPGVTINRVDFRGVNQGVLVSGAVKGLDAAASDIASGFVKQLQADKTLAAHFSAVTLTNLGRNAESSSLNLELNLAFKSAAPKEGAKK